MIFAQKLSKRLGNKKLKAGVSVEEMIFLSFIPFALSFFGIDEVVGVGVMVGVYGVLFLKNQVLAPNFIKNELEHKKEFEWKKVEIRR